MIVQEKKNMTKMFILLLKSLGNWLKKKTGENYDFHFKFTPPKILILQKRKNVKFLHEMINPPPTNLY